MADHPKRKIVQIAISQDATDDPSQTVVALCDDGTVWSTCNSYGWKDWHQLPKIPQGKAHG